MTRKFTLLGSIALTAVLGLSATTASANIWGPFGDRNWDNFGPWNNGYNNGWGRSWGGNWSPWDNGYNNGWGRGFNWSPNWNWNSNSWRPRNGYYRPYPPRAPYYPPQNIPAEPPVNNQQ